MKSRTTSINWNRM